MSNDQSRTTEAIEVIRDAAIGAFRLLVVEGPNAGAFIELDASTPSRRLIGQSAACALALSDRSVSRRHAAVDLHDGGVKVVDLQSTNGTRVNGVRVFEAMLEPGDRLTIGGSTLRLEVVDGAAAAAFSPSTSFGRVLGASTAMRRLYPLCERLALSDLPVSIEGETGTGKELLAEALHEVGPRRNKPFLVFDAAATRGDAALKQLFGDGAAAGESFLEQAHGGTLLVDEIAELGEDAQARLVRYIDRGEARRDGVNVVSPDVRLLVTSRRNLDAAVESGAFREELFFRLAVSRVELPPLRERAGDVEVLARAFWKAMSATGGPFPTALLERYRGYQWPGNVRELRNVVARRITLGAFGDTTKDRGPTLESERIDLVERVLASDLPLGESRALVVGEFERRYVARVLERHGGNVSRAAAASGVARRYFQLLRTRVTGGDP